MDEGILLAELLHSDSRETLPPSECSDHHCRLIEWQKSNKTFEQKWVVRSSAVQPQWPYVDRNLPGSGEIARISIHAWPTLDTTSSHPSCGGWAQHSATDSESTSHTWILDPTGCSFLWSWGAFSTYGMSWHLGRKGRVAHVRRFSERVGRSRTQPACMKFKRRSFSLKVARWFFLSIGEAWMHENLYCKGKLNL